MVGFRLVRRFGVKIRQGGERSVILGLAVRGLRQESEQAAVEVASSQIVAIYTEVHQRLGRRVSQFLHLSRRAVRMVQRRWRRAQFCARNLPCGCEG